MNSFLKISTATLFAAAIVTSAYSQDTREKQPKNNDGKNEEIVIRKKGGKTEKMTIVVDGDKVTINGKPVDEFKNDDVTILKRDRSLAFGPHGRVSDDHDMLMD